MEFQVIDWSDGDEYNSSRVVENDNIINTTYVIHMFGCNKNGDSVHVKVNNFKPYFFVKVPKFFKKHHVNLFKQYLCEKIYYQHKDNIISCNLQKRMDFNGYHSDVDKFIVIHFHNQGAFRSAKGLFKEGKLITTIPDISSSRIEYQTYEANLSPLLRFIHTTKIEPAGWIYINKFKNSTKANTKIDIETEWINVSPYEGDHGVAPLKQASFDIECLADDGISFPDSSKIEDKIIQIGTTVYIYGKDNSKPLKHIICLGKTTELEGTIVESYDTEEEVLLAWSKFIRKLDPDILTGYNIFGFDFRYMCDRAKLLGIEDKFGLLGRLKGIKSEIYEKKLSSSALGFNEMYILPMIGRLQIDLFKVIQRDYNFESYKLDAVSAEFIKGKIIDIKYTKSYTYLFTNIGDNSVNSLVVGNYISIMVNGYKYVENNRKKFKILDIKGNRICIDKLQEKLSISSKNQWCLSKDDIQPKDIFRLQKGTPDDRSLVAKYCIMDNILCNELMDKLDIIVNNIGMANVCYIPMSFLFLRGQGIKAYSLVARQCRIDKYLIPDLRKNKSTDYQGATVLEAQAGGHFYPVACNDFASLYPSSMISHNLSPDTLITDSKTLENIPHITIDVGDNQKYYFVKPEDTLEEDKHNPDVQRNRNGRGILPRILIHLLQSRKDVKKKMASETDPFKKSLLDGLQLSYKLTCNSIYGQCGSGVSDIACKPVASSTTAVGRQLLEYAGKRALELFPGSKLIYGDSVMPYTPLLLRNIDTGCIEIKTIESLSNNWFPYEEFKPFDTIISNRREKQQSTVNFEVWCKDGWNPIKRVIRHKCNKEIFRVNTLHGIIDVTKDHSLMDENGNKCNPANCIINETKLKQSYPLFKNRNLASGLKNICQNLDSFDIKDKKAFLYGFFYINGDCKNNNWEITINNYEYCYKLMNILSNIYPGQKFKIIDTMSVSGNYKIIPENVEKFSTKYIHLFYEIDTKIVPNKILNGTDIEKKSFLLGYYLGNGYRKNKIPNKDIQFSNQGQLGSAQIYYLMKSLGYNVELQIQNNSNNTYYLSVFNDQQTNDCNIIKNMFSLGFTDNYVYDLETEKGTFHGGIGEICLWNTDSIMTKYPIDENTTKAEKLTKAIECAKIVEQVVSKELPWPHKLEYEKTYYPYILYSKKRYSGVMYEDDVENYSKIDNKGIVLKRRDNAKIVKYIFGGCLNIILFEQDVEKAITFMKDSVDKMFRGEFDIGMFIISKALKITKTTPAHKMLADRMAERDIGNAPQLNDRIPYVYIFKTKEETKNMLNEINKDIVEKTKKRKKLLQGDLIETPDYVLEHKLPIDYLFYLTNQLTNPLSQLFAIFENVDGDIDTKEKAFKKRVIKPLEQRYKNTQNCVKTIDMFFKKI